MEQEILKLQISMRYSIFLKIYKNADNLFDDNEHLILLKIASLDGVIKELTSLAVVHDHEEDIVPFPDFLQFHNIGMVDLRKDTALTNKLFYICYILFLYDFDCFFLESQLVFRQVNYTKAAVTKFVLEVIGVFNIANLRLDE